MGVGVDVSDLGDSFRESREERKAIRRTWVACDSCGLKSPVGEPCFKCEREAWLAWNTKRKAKP